MWNALLLSILAAVFVAVSGLKKRVVVETEEGAVRGTSGVGINQAGCPAAVLPHGTPDSWLAVSSFYGIPFAESPTGSRRFRPPEAKGSWKPEVRDAEKVGPSCPQAPLMGHAPSWLPHWAGWSRNEDCLTLNVWTRGEVSGENLSFPDGLRPVVVWLFPGSFVAGDDYLEMGCPIYSGQPWAAEEGIVVVSAQYRLGFLGFADLPELREESGTAGNYGIQDQRLALQWVQRNIKAFGGDPTRVTIMGESSGASSALYHTILPKSQGLFSRTIVQSGYDGTHHEGAPSEELDSQTMGSSFAKALGCSSVECLRNASVDKILDAQETVLSHLDYVNTLMAFAPTADGYEIPLGSTLLAEMQRQPPKVPLLIGTNLNETSVFFCGELKDDLTESGAIDYVRQIAKARSNLDFTDDALRAVMRFYPVGPGGFDNWRAAVLGLSTDAYFTCAARTVARSMPADAEIYRYVLGRSISTARAADKAAKCLGVPHTMDVFYVFGPTVMKPLGRKKSILFDAGDTVLADAMSKAWANFIRGEVPSLKGLGIESWPRWNNSQEPSVWLDSSADVRSSYQAEACDALEAAGLVTIRMQTASAAVVI
eukprot:TRINITY_DN18019_c0_g2_i1.p1 TRINITY_DN18019_c0_g2~~TRINITY_DN18019_c0_g2_i1.p1  ORF type:complete len:596 (-),score=109.94 TRINITY_DN18019_c0_g2_i1:132-1919(-)